MTELVSARNSAESMINATEKAMGELGEQVNAEEKQQLRRR